jgi:hypothetical protein
MSNSPRKDSREDLRKLLRTLHANKSRGRSKRKCMHCGTTEPHGFEACPAINEQFCPKCGVKGHSEAVCSVVHIRAHKRQERTRKDSAGARDRGKG